MSDARHDEIFSRDYSNAHARASSARGSLITLCSQLFRMVLQFGSQIILARILFPEDFGLLALALPIVGLVQILNDVGFGQIIIQRDRIYQSQVSAFFWINLALSSLLAVVLVVVAFVASGSFNDDRLPNLVVVMSLLLPLGALGIFPTALINRQLRYKRLALTDSIGALVLAVVSVAFAYAGFNYWSLVIGQILGTMTSVAINWINCGWLPSRPRRTGGLLNDVAFGGNITGANFINFLSSSGDNIVIGLMLGNVALGLYDRSYRLVAQPLVQLLAPLSRVAVPLLSKIRSDPADFRRVYLFFVRIMTVATWPALAVFAFDGTNVIIALFGERWAEAGPIFSWICIGGMASGLYISASWLYVSTDNTHGMLRFSIVAAVINIVSYIVGSVFGVVAVAAICALTFVFVQTPVLLYGATAKAPIRSWDIYRTLLPMTVAFALSGGVVWLDWLDWLPNRFVTLAAEGCVAYAIMAISLAAFPSGRAFLFEAVSIVKRALVKR